jgi:hypothetical protein
MSQRDPQLIKELLYRCVAELHESAGWDQPSMLVFLQETDDDSATLRYLHEKPIPQVDENYFLLELARTSQAESAGLIRSLIATLPGLIGIGMITIGQITPGMTAEQIGDRRNPEDFVGDTTLRCCRLITLVDMYGNIFHAQHARGAQPLIHQASDQSDGEIYGGPVDALRQFLIAVLKAMPPTEEQIVAIEVLSEMLIDTPEDMLARLRYRTKERERRSWPA